ncbi:hypothetical protein TSOC_011284 [Tetrabaena socialis]|uniref:Uncharacterized protein n=1 Tax=Tetrabaena socialis TaxID=47790 RepID=A0A2J7ZR64_9CHLO|nr:hypothetical protein TSOC_011284 [Tetrabaena socialis]|eukprot:PNH02752.1 hypothetical protein TSOC_011284 [Tetrabaena socialis]
MDTRFAPAVMLSVSIYLAQLGPGSEQGARIHKAAVQAERGLLPAQDPASAAAVLWAISRFERQRAAAIAAAATGWTPPPGASAGGAVPPPPPPPPRRRLSGMEPEELMLMAGETGFAPAAGPKGPGGTPVHMRPPRPWLVRYTPLLQIVHQLWPGAGADVYVV